jgi:hypothetical protein
MLIKVRASSMTCCGSAEVKGDGDGMVGDKGAGMVLTLTMEGQGKGCSGLYWCPGVW